MGKNEIIKKEEIKYSEDEMKRAAYALNMCTVSVAQIIDYNDSYILEQEYEAILNNLNLENIPDDEAFLKILVELLNTITFFRIQEKRKNMLDKQYQKRMKNAIWSAVPNLGVIVAGGNPATMLFSLATQVGAGYMNYRKEKANIVSEKEKEELELEIAAIEQFNAIRRELFTTAWRIAKEYKFPDSYRLTEKQIEQYNEILVDEDNERKFIRLEAIKENFEAYPPYWYYMGHSAAYLAGVNKYKLAQVNQDEACNYAFSDEEKYYISKAKEYFGQYYKMNKYNILREDQITASFALEYVDILLQEEAKDNDLIRELLLTAKKMSGCARDVMQICAISFLQIGELSEAAMLLKQLVNEEYNVATNAKLLSRIYVTQLLNGEKPKYRCGDKELSYNVRVEYNLLTHRVNESYLFRMPEVLDKDLKKQDAQLQDEYLVKQRRLLVVAYRKALIELEHKLGIEFNHIWFPNAQNIDDFFEISESAKSQRICLVKEILESDDAIDYIAEMRSIGFRYRYSDLLNRTVNIFDSLCVFRNSEKKDVLIRQIRKKFINVIPLLNEVQNKLNAASFKFEDFDALQQKVSYHELTSDFFDKARKILLEEIENECSLTKLEEAESDLFNICDKEHLPKPDIEKKVTHYNPVVETIYFEYDIFGDDASTEENRQKKFEKMQEVVLKSAESFSGMDEKKIKFILRTDYDFDAYFSNSAFKSGGIKAKTVAILDDRTYINDDILFTIEGLVIVSRNEIKGTFPYDDIVYESGIHGNEKIVIGDTYEFSNGIFMLGIDIKALKKLIDEIGKIK